MLTVLLRYFVAEFTAIQEVRYVFAQRKSI